MEGFGKELIRWLIGGGALALLTFGGTTYYQQVQLELQEQEQQAQQELDRQKFLRDFLSKHVDIATKGSLEERLRFASYFTALGADNLGVNFDNYKETLILEARAVDRAAVKEASPPKKKNGGEGRGGNGGETGSGSGSGGTGSNPQTDTGNTGGTKDNPKDRPARPEREVNAATTAKVTGYLVTGLSKTVIAREAERNGFLSILGNDFAAAQKHFADAEEAWPTYHNVSELHRLTAAQVKAHGGGPLPDAAFKATLKEILKKYSWGMPDDVKASMQKLTRN